jgi:Wzt C-terminal domain
VILVSHQLTQIRRLCQRTVWLDGGAVRRVGATPELVSAYEDDMTSSGADDVRPIEGACQFLRWRLLGENRTSDHILPSETEATVSFLLRVNEPLKSVHHGIGLYDQDRHLLWGNAVDGISLEPGLYELQHTIANLPLRPGVYSWRIAIYDGGVRVDDWECVPQMQVVTVPITHYRDEAAGVLNIPSKLEIIPAAAPK